MARALPRPGTPLAEFALHRRRTVSRTSESFGHQQISWFQCRFRSEVADRFFRVRCRDFKSAALVRRFRSPHHLCGDFVMRTS